MVLAQAQRSLSEALHKTHAAAAAHNTARAAHTQAHLDKVKAQRDTTAIRARANAAARPTRT